MKFLILLCALVSTTLAFDSVPLFMWGKIGSPDTIPALSHFTSDEFAHYIVKKTSNEHHVPIVAFFEDELRMEDFKTCSNCFKNLQSRSPKVYFPAIEAPLAAFSALQGLQAVETKYLALSTETIDSVVTEIRGAIRSGAAKNFIITFGDSDLAEHDQLIADVQKKLDNGEIVYIYTAENSGRIHDRIARQAAAAAAAPTNATKATEKPKVVVEPRQEVVADGHFINVESGRFIMYYKKMINVDGENQVDFNITTWSYTAVAEGLFNVTLQGTGGQTLNLQLKTEGGYWSLNGLVYNDKVMYLNTDTYVAIPLGLSYACTDSQAYHTAETSTTVLIISGLQIEPDFKETPDLQAFSDAWHCVGFTSPGILGGLFVVIILLGILSIGITCMMSINTMDRFDDPKGKTITVNVGE